ncbi:MAG: glycerol kinase GlpK [Firmicutes bacterium]|nr:glycerol kinase GlpK [Bacillota bacterium]
MGEPCIISVDEGTTGTRALLVDGHGQVIKQAYRRLNLFYPHPGWVEQDAMEIWESTRVVLAEVIDAARAMSRDIVGLAITNQRETVVMWDATTGEPLHPAIVWQCRRTEKICDGLKAEGLEELIRAKTGLPIDPYFSATKMAWMLTAVDGVARLARQDRVCLGTVDSWLVWNLTGGKAHVTDVSNAARTQLMDIHTLSWSETLAEIFDVPLGCLPKIVPSGGELATTSQVEGISEGIPILAIMGDSQAALYGEAAFEPGDAKVTYGTGSSILVNTGKQPRPPENGLATTVAWQVHGETFYALEGIIHSTGAGLEWLREGLQIISDAAESEALAQSVPDAGDVFFVPAFAGLGTPWWNASARGVIVGITRGTKREHIVRAALDAIALQVRDVFDVIDATTSDAGGVVYCSGGGSRNRYLMQLQADLLQRPIITAMNPEASARGVATMAGLVADLWSSRELVELHRSLSGKHYVPKKTSAEMEPMVSRWHEAVKRSLNWS